MTPESNNLFEESLGRGGKEKVFAVLSTLVDCNEPLQGRNPILPLFPRAELT